MRCQDFFVKQNKHDHFFVRILSMMLLSVLVLITAIFLLIYSNLNAQTLRSAYTREQENIVNISYSATLMDDAAISALDQLYSNPRIKQLVYAKHLKDTTAINSIILFKEYIKASSWIDSAYMVNVDVDTVIYAGYSKDDNSKRGYKK